MLMAWLPDVALMPLHAPEAAQVLALLLDQVRVEALPFVTGLGLAERVTVEGGWVVEAPRGIIFH